MTQTSISAAGTAASTAVTPGVDPAARAQQRAELEKAVRGFEAIFTRQLLSTMRGASLGEGLGDSSAVEQFREMSDAQMASDLSNKGALGIAEMLLQQLDKR